MALVVTGAIPAFLAAGLAPRLRTDFGFPPAALGLAAAVFYAVSMAGSTVLGRWVDRVGAHRGMRACAGTTAAACVGIALVADSAAALTALLALAGVGNALASPAVSAMLKEQVAVARQGFAFGTQQAGAPVGALLAGLALPAVAVPFGWRWAYVGVAVLALAAAAVAPHTRGRPRDAAAARSGRGLTAVHALGAAAALASAAGVGFISFLVVYAIESGMSETAAGFLLAGVSLGAAASRIVLGLAADRGRQEALRPVAAMFAVAVAGYALLTVDDPPAIAVGALVAGGFGWAWPGALNLAVVQRSPQAPAWGVGVMMTGLFAGAIAGPLGVGLLAERDAFAAAWLTCGALTLLAALTVIAVRRREQRSRRDRGRAGGATPPARGGANP